MPTCRQKAIHLLLEILVPSMSCIFIGKATPLTHVILCMNTSYYIILYKLILTTKAIQAAFRLNSVTGWYFIIRLSSFKLFRITGVGSTWRCLHVDRYVAWLIVSFCSSSSISIYSQHNLAFNIYRFTFELHMHTMI